MSEECVYAYSRTSAFGTVIERILHGSFTGPTPHDVVLVKPNSLELLQLTPLHEEGDNVDDDQVLSPRFEQPTFGTITDARVLPCRFQIHDGVDDDEDEYMDKGSGSNRSEMDYEVEQGALDEVPYAFKLRQGHAPIQGEDVIVAVSDYGKLVFWGITSSTSDLTETGRFEPLIEVFMDEPGLEYQKVSKKLSVDPYSRAIAIAAYEDRFDIMIMNENVSRVHFDPIIGMGSVSEEGIIWHMEFLYTESKGRDRILLALMVFNDIETQCRIIVYAIDASNPADVLIERVGRLPLDIKSPIPILFIPLKHHPEGFLMITENEAGLVTIEDIACGNLYYPKSLIPRPFGEIKCPLLTAYAMPLSPSQTTAPYMYLGSDNGCLFKLSFPPKQEIQWEELQSVNPVGQAMCVLGVMEIADGANEEYLADVILYAGEGADSQMIAIPRERGRQHLDVLIMQNFVNHAPIFDQRIWTSATGQDMIVGCTGQGKHGSLCTIMRGVRTTILHTIGGAWKETNRMWSTLVETDCSSRHPILILSSPCKHAIISAHGGVLEELNGTRKDGQLILADSILIGTKRLLIQVFSDGIVIFENIRQGNITETCLPTPKEIQSITLATICQSHSARPGYIAVSYVDETGQSFIALLDVKVDNGRMSLEPLLIRKITSEPSYLGYFAVNEPILVVGTYDASLYIYSLEEKRLLQQLDQQHLSEESQGKDHECVVIHSAAVLEAPKKKHTIYDDRSENSNYILLLGTRLGSILCLPLASHDQQSIGRFFCRDRYNMPVIATRQIGKRSVRFDLGQRQPEAEYTASSSILALSEQLWRIRYNDAYLDSVEIDPVIMFPPFSCLSSVVSFSINDIHRDMVGLVADGQFHIMTIAPQCSLSAQKIAVKETVNKIMIDQSTGNAFVAAIAMDPSNYRIRNTVQMIENTTQNGSQKTLLNEKIFQPTDEILCMAEWTLSNQGKNYRYLCLGIGQTNHASYFNRVKKAGTNRGALMIYRLKTTKTADHVSYTVRPVMSKDHLPGGVFAICSHPAGLLFSAGAILYLYQLDTSTKEPRLIEIAKKTLRFLITSIQVQGDQICVSCQTDSVSFYKFNAESRKLDFLKSDVTARTLHHTTMITDRIAVCAGQSGGLIALWDNPADKSFEERLITLFSFQYSDIILRPVLASLLPSAILDVVLQAQPIAGHILPWARNIASDAAKPIMGVTVSGCVVRVHKISQPLYHLLIALQERILIYSSALFIPLGSARDFRWFSNLSQKEKHVVHGDLLVLFLRLLPEQQREIVEMNEPEQPSIVKATRTFLETSARDTFALDHRELAEEKDDKTILWEYASKIAAMLVQVLGALERCC